MFNDRLVLPFAEDDPNARCIVLVAKQVIHCRQVEVHLACKLGLELLNLEFHHDEAAQAKMVEEQVQVVVLSSDLEVVLATYKSKAFAKLQDKGAKMFKKAKLQLSFGHLRPKGQEVEAVGIPN